MVAPPRLDAVEGFADDVDAGAGVAADVDADVDGPAKKYKME